MYAPKIPGNGHTLTQRKQPNSPNSLNEREEKEFARRIPCEITKPKTNKAKAKIHAKNTPNKPFKKKHITFLRCH